MNALAQTAAALSDPGQFARDIATSAITQWCERLDAFCRWEYAHVLPADAAAETVAQHRSALALLLRITNHFHAATLDPDFPAPELETQLRRRLSRLEQSWRIFNNPLSAAEADAVIAECFPG